MKQKPWSNVAVGLLPSLTLFFSHTPTKNHLSMGGDTHNEPGASPSVFSQENVLAVAILIDSWEIPLHQASF